MGIQHVESTVGAFGPQINSVLDVLNTEIHRPDHEFNQGATESINCLNGELELKDGGWHLMPHVREH